MQRNLCLILIVSLILAACGGSPEPTADSSNVTDQSAETTPEPVGVTPDLTATLVAQPTQEIQQRSFGTDEPPLPQPGTIIAPTTPDPEAGLVFDSIEFVRTGGLAGQTLTIVINSDGTFTRDGVAGSITPAQVTLIDDLIDQLNFFGLQGMFTAPGTSADVYHYAVTVNRAGASRTLRASDGFIPDELVQFFSLLSSLGEPAP